ncbi:MAG: sterol desaturase family protein [Bacteroidia bacterium]|nr:sterol desaturase family protein [Bacteroidia bacterium]
MQGNEHLLIFEKTYPYLIGILLASLVLNALAHRKSNWKLNLSNSFTNLSQLFTEQLFKEVLLKSLLFSGYGLVYHYFHLFEFKNQWYHWLVAFLLIDFIGYCEHYAAHRVNLLWAIHEMHHQAEEMNMTVTPRNHWLDGFIKSKFNLPLALLGISPEMLLIISLVSAFYTLLIHTEVIRNFGPLNLILAAPDHHRVHHGKNPQYLDKNFGIVLIVWDRLFGTFQPENEKVVYGITATRNRSNLIYLNTARFMELWKESTNQKGLRNKVKWWFAPPQGAGVKVSTASTNQTRVISGHFYYTMFQFIHLIGWSSLFFQIDLNLAKSLNWLVGLSLFAGFCNQGFPRFLGWKWIEWLRLSASLALAWAIPYPYNWMLALPCFFSIIWMYQLEERK